MTPGIVIQQMELGDLETVCIVCREIYSQNFHSHWNEDGLEIYMDDVFGIDTLAGELSNKNIRYYMAFTNGEPVAFMKINLCSNLPGFDMEKGMELEKIYILPQFKGMKIGRRLLDTAFDIASISQKEICWLSVIDTNREAISFYEKGGFRFHSTTRLDYPKFKEELKGMWRMFLELARRSV